MNNTIVYNEEHVNEKIDYFKDFLLRLKSCDFSNISDDGRSKFYILFERFSHLVASWESHDKNGYFDHKIDKGLWGNKLILRHLFENHVVYEKDGNHIALFCTVCKVKFGCNQNELICHMESAPHLLCFDACKTAETNKLWGEHHLYRYAYDKFIEIRLDNVLYCRICYVDIPFSSKYLLSHVENDSHFQKFKRIIDMKLDHLHTNSVLEVDVDNGVQEAKEDEKEQMVSCKKKDKTVKNQSFLESPKIINYNPVFSTGKSNISVDPFILKHQQLELNKKPPKNSTCKKQIPVEIDILDKDKNSKNTNTKTTPKKQSPVESNILDKDTNSRNTNKKTKPKKQLPVESNILDKDTNSKNTNKKTKPKKQLLVESNILDKDTNSKNTNTKTKPKKQLPVESNILDKDTNSKKTNTKTKPRKQLPVESNIIDKDTNSKNTSTKTKLNNSNSKKVSVDSYQRFMDLIRSDPSTMKLYCQPCNYYEICSIDLSLHARTRRHLDMTLLKTNFEGIPFQWHHCEICNVYLYCQKPFVSEHDLSSIHVSMKMKLHNSSKHASGGRQPYKLWYGECSVETSIFGQHLKACLENLSNHLEKIKKNVRYYYYYCYPCNYYVCDPTKWAKHKKSDSHKYVLDGSFCKVFNCDCYIQVICRKEFLDEHAKTNTHSKLKRLIKEQFKFVEKQQHLSSNAITDSSIKEEPLSC